MKASVTEALDWDKVAGLLPAIIQDIDSGEVLMLGYMNHEALQQTLETKKVTFFSRSKNRLWVKGETSGNYLNLVDITVDCDQDSLLLQVRPEGVTCHLGKKSCFDGNKSGNWKVLAQLEATIRQRAVDLPEASYTATLIKEGLNVVSQKVGEEAVETVIAALVQDDQQFCNEAADLLFHLLVLLNIRQLALADVIAVLKSRAG